MRALQYVERVAWDRLWGRWGVAANTDVWFARITAAYGEPRRHYHNLQHVDACLEQAEALQETASDIDAVRAALWFHDVVYDPKSHTNEQDSALLFQEFAQAVGLGADRVCEVQRLIELTAGHVVAVNDRNGAVMADADLAVLGASAEAYRDYADAIRSEYAFVEESNYARGRREVLERFLERSVIYQTSWMRDRYEQQARLNLRSEIEKLSLLP
ncbi:HD domain-containing protein [Synoicihabitans lomoniglobus]|uniref:Metal-dependent phosphohydrolase n=1 Tax=Synoicihabitans lomoniglobus TaxID=2909285 RepID=A0AAE9ZVW2_9BACT|nr:hypothetical protein [Opitutaceae bacterium LMO-M01]WED65082.1 hypothetical protein PXH66_22315 [Opitutaceae bacterium LMO-M01]